MTLVHLFAGPLDGMATEIGDDMPAIAEHCHAPLELVLRDLDGSTHIYVVNGERADYRGVGE